MINARLAILAALLVSGCATSTVNYTPPSEISVVNSKRISTPFEKVWDQLVKNLATDFFVINNIEKNSRLINVSFSTSKPSDYVDCGLTMRTFKGPQGDRSYDYYTADSSQYAHANQQGAVFRVNRNTRLEGRTNIYVAPEGDGTLLTVNTKYVLTIDLQATNPAGRAENRRTVADLLTKSPYRGEGGVICYAKGRIEERILSLVN